MKHIILFLIITAIMTACAGEEADLRRHGYAANSADAQGAYNDSIHWDDTQLPANETASQDETTDNAEDPDTVEEEAPADETADDETTDEDVAIRDLATSVGFRNLDQIRYSMASVTGIPVENTNIQTAYAELRAQLPGSNDLRELTPAKISAITKLGAQFCDEAMRSPATRAAILPGINFGAPPSTALAAPEGAAQMLISGFWGENLEKQADPADDIATIAALIQDLMTEQPNTAESTINIMMGACTAVISSAPFLIL